jgi:hypothetical protein
MSEKRYKEYYRGVDTIQKNKGVEMAKKVFEKVLSIRLISTIVGLSIRKSRNCKVFGYLLKVGLSKGIIDQW